MGDFRFMKASSKYLYLFVWFSYISTVLFGEILFLTSYTCAVNIHNTHVLPQRMKVVAAYRRCMYAYLMATRFAGADFQCNQNLNSI